MKQAGDILKELMARIEEQNSETAQTVPLFRGWEKIVGTDLAAHCKLMDIEKGFLKIQVDHPGWIQMLQFKEKKIISALSKQYKELEIRGMKLFLRSSH